MTEMMMNDAYNDDNDEDEDDDDGDDDNDAYNDDSSGLFQKNIKFTEYYAMMECQLLHHIDTQIIETIEKLEWIDTTE